METLFEKIGNNRTLSQEIEKKIETAILEKKLVPGQKLPTEKELCEMFGVSRTALREALQMLSARGLLYIRKGSGVFVNDFSPRHISRQMRLYLDLNFNKNDVLHLAHVRQMIEPLNARLAAKHRTRQQLEVLEDNLERFRNPEAGPDELAHLDVEFHLNIANATGNPIIPLMMDPVFSLFSKVKVLIVKDLKIRGEFSYRHHRSIFEMIKQKNQDGAFEEMTKHLRRAERDMKLLFKHLEERD
ncbi:MAG: FadR family transcriptional regulator [Calditrichaeota bacterium]|nr:MAG: FadR family transcriptional regulator [Calditrichota bacterium]